MFLGCWRRKVRRNKQIQFPLLWLTSCVFDSCEASLLVARTRPSYVKRIVRTDRELVQRTGFPSCDSQCRRNSHSYKNKASLHKCVANLIRRKREKTGQMTERVPMKRRCRSTRSRKGSAYLARRTQESVKNTQGRAKSTHVMCS